MGRIEPRAVTERTGFSLRYVGARPLGLRGRRAPAFVPPTGADGTRYTLTIPAGALASPETVRVAPLLAVAGLGGVAGVSLLPAGLRLLAPATLVVAPARAVSGFAFRGGGAALHAAPAIAA